MTAEQDFTDAIDGYNVYWEEGTHDVPTEYAVYGWVKLNEAITDDEEQLVLRFSTNTDDVLGDADSLGDRTFLISVNKDNVLIQSYTYDILYLATSKSFYNTIPNQADLSDWTFVYIGYSHHENKISVFLKFTDREEKLTMQAKHFYTKYHQIKMGKDSWFPAFNG